MTDPSQPGDGGSGWGPPPPRSGAPAGSTPTPGQSEAAPEPGSPSPGGAAPPPETHGPGWFGQVAESGYQPGDEEREYAFYAHLGAAIAAFVSCSLLLPIVVPIVVYALSKDRPPFLLYHVHQSLVFQAVCSAAQVLVTVLGAASSFFCVGWALFLLGFVPWLLASIYGFVAALRARSGDWRAYPFLTDKLLYHWKPFLT